ncbi:MAG: CoA-binding protein [Chloroflexi bacterium HGW-Chloroflexi-8]|jgi:hypothetical protein|nr:MAG: CoA-binding protein [Chloroflexi bacterium HGW-Chloroflexi-8]
MATIKSEFLRCKRIAVYGVSRSDAKFGNAVFRELKSRGYKVFPIHPDMEKIDEDPCYKSISEIEPAVDGVLINVKPTKVVEILKDVIKSGVKNVWLQQGSESEDALKFAQDNNLNVSSNGCILMYMEPVKGLHSAHRWIWRLIKQY